MQPILEKLYRAESMSQQESQQLFSAIVRGELERRVGRILDEQRDRRTQVGRRVRWTVVVCLAAVSVIAGTTRIVAVAEEAHVVLEQLEREVGVVGGLDVVEHLGRIERPVHDREVVVVVDQGQVVEELLLLLRLVEAASAALCGVARPGVRQRCGSDRGYPGVGACAEVRGFRRAARGDPAVRRG